MTRLPFSCLLLNAFLSGSYWKQLGCFALRMPQPTIRKFHNNPDALKRNRVSPMLQMSTKETAKVECKALMGDIRKALGGGNIPCVVVKRDKQSKSFREGSPLVFSGAISYTVGNDKNGIHQGALVAVAVAPKESKSANSSKRYSSRGKSPKEKQFDARHYLISGDDSDLSQLDKESVVGAQMIGFGFYNPSSMYRTRIALHETSDPTLFRNIKRNIASDESTTVNEALRDIFQANISNAIRSRILLGFPNSETDTFRLVNGEGDSLSGLAVDILGSKIAVVMSSAAWCEIHKDIILDVLSKELKLMFEDDVEVVWRTTESRLAQDGINSSSEANETYDQIEDGRYILATEANVQYKLYPWSGQKTGFYCDQRENRQQVAKLCDGKRVLDLCCYNGGFALNAALHGASSCTGVDSSQDAVDAAISNASLNNLPENVISFERADIADFMKVAYEKGKRYDVIVLDPPKLAPSVAGLNQASRKYHALNRDAIKLIDEDKGGLLLTCTCSGAMSQKDGGLFFLQTVQNAAISARRQISLLKKMGAAPCHTQNPAASPAGMYLTAALFYVSPSSSD